MRMKMFVAVVTSSIILTGCGNSEKIDTIIKDQEQTESSSLSTSPYLSDQLGVTDSSGEYDIDLTQLSPSMVYAQVYDMVYNGDDYIGKTIKVKGPFSYYQEPDGREFFAVIISDATACCSQGIEFVLDGDYTYPDDYPSIGTEITVVGKFNYYKENYNTYCQLTDATMEADKSLSWE